ncbi:MAG: energy transducer TonB [Gemmatimonadales bacterium]
MLPRFTWVLLVLTVSCVGHPELVPELNAPVLLAAAGGDSLLPENLVTTRPRPIRGEGPHYPPDLRSRDIGGSVTTGLVISSAGIPDSTSVTVLSSTNNGFDPEVLRFVRHLRFHPGLLNGRRVAVRITQTLIFRPAVNPTEAKQ